MEVVEHKDYGAGNLKYKYYAEAPEVVPPGYYPRGIKTRGLDLVAKHSVVASPYSDIEKEAVLPIPRRTPPKSDSFKISKKGVIIFIVCFILIGLGIGLGVGLSARAREQANVPPANATNKPKASYRLLNDTSFAVITSKTSGDRHVFFQDSAGILRQAIYNKQSSIWDTSAESIVSRDARNHTPIAALERNGGISLFYVQLNDSLTAMQYDSLHGWARLMDPENVRYTIDADSRSLSASEIPSKSSNTTAELLIFCQGVVGPKGTLNTLRVAPQDFDSNYRIYQINDITEQTIPKENSTVYPKFFNGPFTSGPSLSAIGEKLNTSTVVLWVLEEFPKGYTGYYMPHFSYRNGTLQHDGDGATGIVDSNSIFSSGILGRHNRQPNLISTWDVVTPGNGRLLWINQNTKQLQGLDIEVPQPSNPFPFNRLAVTNQTVTNGRAEDFHLYHQVNEGIIAEEQFVVSGGYWKSVNITIGS